MKYSVFLIKLIKSSMYLSSFHELFILTGVQTYSRVIKLFILFLQRGLGRLRPEGNSIKFDKSQSHFKIPLNFLWILNMFQDNLQV